MYGLKPVPFKPTHYPKSSGKDLQVYVCFTFKG
jgi:hypothetical protein